MDSGMSLAFKIISLGLLLNRIFTGLTAVMAPTTRVATPPEPTAISHLSSLHLAKQICSVI